MALWRAKDKPPVELVVANLVDLVTEDIQTEKIEEIMLIRLPEDLEKFKEIYEITEKIAKEY